MAFIRQQYLDQYREITMDLILATIEIEPPRLWVMVIPQHIPYTHVRDMFPSNTNMGWFSATELRFANKSKLKVYREQLVSFSDGNIWGVVRLYPDLWEQPHLALQAIRSVAATPKHTYNIWGQ